MFYHVANANISFLYCSFLSFCWYFHFIIFVFIAWFFGIRKISKERRWWCVFLSVLKAEARLSAAVWVLLSLLWAGSRSLRNYTMTAAGMTRLILPHRLTWPAPAAAATQQILDTFPRWPLRNSILSSRPRVPSTAAQKIMNRKYRTVNNSEDCQVMKQRSAQNKLKFAFSVYSGLSW